MIGLQSLQPSPGTSLNTRQLRNFLAVLDLGSLSAAAEAVHLSQPALSRSLRALEDALGVPLFDRNDRRLRPTPYALAYRDRARRMVFDEKEGARSLALMRSGELGSLAFGMGSSIAQSLLPRLMLALLAQAPQVRLDAMVQTTDVLFAALAREQLDFFIGDVRIARHDPDMQVEPLYRCSFGWFARAGHPLAGRKRVTIKDLSAYPIIGAGYADEAVEHRLAQLYDLRLPLAENFAVSTGDVATVHALLSASDATAPSTDIAVIGPLRAGSAVQLNVVPALDLDLTLGIIHRAGRTLTPAAARAFALIRAHFSEVEVELATLRRGRRATRARTQG
jgi:DNA-binding transcriptional LysR family regulator